LNKRLNISYKKNSPRKRTTAPWRTRGAGNMESRKSGPERDKFYFHWWKRY
jgi:hypothetical protein